MKGQDMTAIKEYIKKRQKSRYSTTTLRNHENILNNAARYVKKRFGKALIQATTTDLEAYLDQCGAVTTRRTKRSVLKAFFGLNVNLRVDTNDIDFEELKVLVKETDRSPISAPTPAKVAEIRQLKDIKPLYKLLFNFLVETGMRVGSAVAINHEDLVFDINRIQLNNTKGGKVFKLKVPQSLLDQYLSVFPDNIKMRGRIFRFTDNRALKIITMLGKRVGIKLAPHALRKYFACMTYYKTKDLLAVQRALSHSNAVTTSNYLNRDYEEFEERMDMFNERAT